MKTKLKSAAAVLGMALAMLFTVASPASADASGCDLNSLMRTPNGSACFKPYGDYVWVHDQAADSASVIGYWRTNYGRSGECVNSNGGGTEVTCNYNMDEDYQVQIRTVVYDYSAGRTLYDSGWSMYVGIS